MSAAALDGLIASEEGLIAALDGGDAAAIEAALLAFRYALEEVKAAGGWREAPRIVERITHALQLADAARIRTNYLADRTRRQLDRLARPRAATRATAYGRDGRLRA